MIYLYALDFPFKNFCKLAQHAETVRKRSFGKRVMTCTHGLKSIDHNKSHFDLFFTTISASKKLCVYFSDRELIKALHDTLTRAAWTLINNGKLAKQINSK